MNEAINDSLKQVSKSAELVKKYLEENDIENDSMLEDALKLLENVVEALSKTI